MKTLLVYSSKGGVGKSTISCNLSFALQSLGYKVGIFDTDFKTPSLPFLISGLTYKTKPYIQKLRIKPAVLDCGMIIQSTGYFNDKEMQFWPEDYLEGAVWQLFDICDWESLDYLVVDMPPCIDSLHSTICSLFPSAKVLLISTHSPLSVEDSLKGITFMEELGLNILGFVMNMVYIKCANCEKKNYIFDKNTSRINYPVFANVPISKTIIERTFLGIPIFMNNSNSEEKGIFLDLAMKIQRLL